MPINEFVVIECSRWTMRTEKKEISKPSRRYVTFVGKVSSGRIRSAAGWYISGADSLVRMYPVDPDEEAGALSLKVRAEEENLSGTIDGLLTLQEAEFDRLILSPLFSGARQCALILQVTGAGHFATDEDFYRSHDDKLDVWTYAIEFDFGAVGIDASSK